MGLLQKLLKKAGWHEVYDISTEGGRARSCLLGAAVSQGVVNSLSTGIFYTGLLMGYGFNIVNLSILAVIPHIASLFTLFSPYILERFKKRRAILSVSRTLYYAINILGITLLPQLVSGEAGRIWGLIAITFISNAIYYLFYPGYTVWQMPYITPEVRSGYYSSIDMTISLSSTIFMVVAGLVTDRLEGQAQLNMIIALRYAALIIAFLDVYFLQKPKEPVYETSTNRPKLLDIFRLPLSNKKFLLTTLIFCIYSGCSRMGFSLVGAWMLDEIGTGYMFTNLLEVPYFLFVLLTTRLWTAFTNKFGTFKGLALGIMTYVPTYLLYGLVNPENFRWTLFIIRMSQEFFSLAIVLPLNNLMYVNTPVQDRTNYLSFYSIAGSAATFIGTSAGAAVVAAMGSTTWSFLGNSISSIPTLLVIEGVVLGLLSVFILLIRKHVEPDVVR